jgi:hypothetical protein
MSQRSLETRFSVIGSLTTKKFFPKGEKLPRPGQWVFVGSDALGINRFIGQIAAVSIKTLEGAKDVYQVTCDINRISPKEDILFAKLARRQFDLTDRQGESLEPLTLADTSTKEEIFTITNITGQAAYSNVNYSNGEYSGA